MSRVTELGGGVTRGLRGLSSVSSGRGHYRSDSERSAYEGRKVDSQWVEGKGIARARALRAARGQASRAFFVARGEEVNGQDFIDGQVVSYQTGESIPLKDAAVRGLLRPDSARPGGPVGGHGPMASDRAAPAVAQLGQSPRTATPSVTGCQAPHVELDTQTGEVADLAIAPTCGSIDSLAVPSRRHCGFRESFRRTADANAFNPAACDRIKCLASTNNVCMPGRNLVSQRT